MRWSSFTRTSSSVRAASMPRRSSLDGKRGRDNCVHIFLTATGVVDAVVADLRRVARGDLVDTELCSPHRAELAAEALHQDLGALPGIGGGGGERVELRLRQLGRDVGRLFGGDVDPLRDEQAHAWRGAPRCSACACGGGGLWRGGG